MIGKVLAQLGWLWDAQNERWRKGKVDWEEEPSFGTREEVVFHEWGRALVGHGPLTLQQELDALKGKA